MRSTKFASSSSSLSSRPLFCCTQSSMVHCLRHIGTPWINGTLSTPYRYTMDQWYIVYAISVHYGLMVHCLRHIGTLWINGTLSTPYRYTMDQHCSLDHLGSSFGVHNPQMSRPLFCCTQSSVWLQPSGWAVAGDFCPHTRMGED